MIIKRIYSAVMALAVMCLIIQSAPDVGAQDSDRKIKCKNECCEKAMGPKDHSCFNACLKIADKEKQEKCYAKCLKKRNVYYRACLRRACRMSAAEIKAEPNCGK